MVEAVEEKVKVEIPEPYIPEQDAFVRCNSLRQIIKAGRQSGKTYGCGIKACIGILGVCSICLGEGCLRCDNTGKVEPKRVLYAAPTLEQVDAFWDTITEILAPLIEVGQLKKNETEHTIEVPGTQIRIKAKTAWNAAMMRGDWADLAILEEYQLWNEDGWESVVQPMLLKRNGVAIFVFTPPSLRSEGTSKAKDRRHASKMFKKYEHDESGRWKTFHFTSFVNPFLSKEALEELTTSGDMSRDSYRREILAEDDEVELSWLVYGKFKEEKCKIKRFEIPANWDVITGHDFGKANPAALFVARVKLPIPIGAPSHLRYNDYVIFKEYAPGGGFSAAQHVDRFKEMVRGYRVEQSIGGNITTEDEIRQAYGSNGWAISAPSITRVNAQIDRVIGLIEADKIYIFEDLYGVLGQFASCMWKLDNENKPTNEIKDESKWHFLSCLRYLATYLPAERLFSNTEFDKIKVGVW